MAQEWRFSVGQILYLVLLREQDVVAVQVIEENRRTVLGGGTCTAYTVQLSAHEGAPTFELDPALHEAFDSSTGLQQALRRRAVAAVDGLVERAVEESRRAFPDVQAQQEPEAVPEQPAEQSVQGTTLLQLPDGCVVRARIKGPKES
jgi:hypothetical protein